MPTNTEMRTLRRRQGRPKSNAPRFDPVDPSLDEPLERQVYRSIRRGMMRGLVSPEMVLTGRSVAQHMNVSVQPVRDALKRMEADGAIIGRPQSGFHLPGMTKEEYWEIIDIRVRLEGLAGRLAATNMTPDTVAHLRSLNRMMCTKLETKDSKDSLAANFAFHFSIYTEAKRPSLLALIENFWVRIGPFLHHHPPGHRSNDLFLKHEIIIDALERGDAPSVETAIFADLTSAAHRLVENLPSSNSE